MGHRVLFISPHVEDAVALRRMVANLPMELEHVANLDEARARLKRNRFGAVLTEACLNDGTWHDLLRLTRELPASPAVVVTHLVADDRFWAEVLNLGCYDMLAQPFDTREVQRILTLACGQTPAKPVRSAASSPADTPPHALSASC